MKRFSNLILLILLGGLGFGANAGGDPKAGEALANKTCQSCHASDGNSTDPQYPRLAGQYADYIEKALTDYKSGARSNPIMAGFSAGLSEQDIKDVAAWFSSQSGLDTPVLPNTISQ